MDVLDAPSPLVQLSPRKAIVVDVVPVEREVLASVEGAPLDCSVLVDDAALLDALIVGELTDSVESPGEVRAPGTGSSWTRT